jgi:hypothetical protein
MLKNIKLIFMIPCAVFEGNCSVDIQGQKFWKQFLQKVWYRLLFRDIFKADLILTACKREISDKTNCVLYRPNLLVHISNEFVSMATYLSTSSK